jgi:hypothetical protein
MEPAQTIVIVETPLQWEKPEGHPWLVIVPAVSA